MALPTANGDSLEIGLSTSADFMIKKRSKYWSKSTSFSLSSSAVHDLFRVGGYEEAHHGIFKNSVLVLLTLHGVPSFLSPVRHTKAYIQRFRKGQGIHRVRLQRVYPRRIHEYVSSYQGDVGRSSGTIRSPMDHGVPIAT